MYLRDEEDGVSYGREQVDGTTVKRRRDRQRRKSEEGNDERQRGKCNGEAIRGCYSIVDNTSPRMDRGVRRESEPENIYQVLLDSDHDDMQEGEGEWRGKL